MELLLNQDFVWDIRIFLKSEKLRKAMDFIYSIYIFCLTWYFKNLILFHAEINILFPTNIADSFARLKLTKYCCSSYIFNVNSFLFMSVILSKKQTLKSILFFSYYFLVCLMLLAFYIVICVCILYHYLP